MKKPFMIFALLLASAAALLAVPTDITFTEGEARVRFGNGQMGDANIGDVLNTGDTIRTGADGIVELDQRGVVMKVSPGTVFTLMERSTGGENRGVLSVVLGSLQMKFDKLTGREPLLQTASCAAGVRGTELTIFAGADGSSLIAVDSGEVVVEAEGKTVALAAGEGVEVKPGRPPGDKFIVQRNQIDYRKWNDDKLKAMLADPVGAIASLREQLDAYAANVGTFFSDFQASSARLAQERQKTIEMLKEKTKDEVKKYQDEVVLPLTGQTANLFLNMRYNALAALSMRRYVAGRLYVMLKSRYITRPDDPVYIEFLSKYREFLADFEVGIAPHLGDADI
jgi:hypothetical protein